MKLALRTYQIEEIMKKQIIQILHNLIGKGTKPDGNKADPEISRASDTTKSDDALRDEATVQVVDQRTFEKKVNDSLSVGQGMGCLLVCNVDRFREINDIYGHDTGDAVLRHVASVLCGVFKEYACIGSPDGDRFALWLAEISQDSAEEIRKLTGIVNDRLLHPAGEIPPVSVSVGAAFCKKEDDGRSLGKRANKALYLVKEGGRCGCEVSL